MKRYMVFEIMSYGDGECSLHLVAEHDDIKTALARCTWVGNGNTGTHIFDAQTKEGFNSDDIDESYEAAKIT